MSADLPAFRAEDKRESQRLRDRCAMSQKLLFICFAFFAFVFAARLEMSLADLSSAETHKREPSRSLLNSDQIRHSESLKIFNSAHLLRLPAIRSRVGGFGDENFRFSEFNSRVMLDIATLSSAFVGNTREAWVCAEELPKKQQILQRVSSRRSQNPPGNVTACK